MSGGNRGASFYGEGSALVRDGQQAIDAFASRPQGTYDAILMDIVMPKMDGFEAARQIRRVSHKDA